MIERRALDIGFLGLATLALLAPFLTKAFCIDDPLFLWSAAQIRVHPFDFFGAQVNWYDVVMPLYDVTRNPPLMSYYLALASALFGWSEVALHAACLLPAVGAIWGTWQLARSLCSAPVFAAILALITPAFLVSSTNLMCDTMMLCAWVWAIALWIRGLDSESSIALVASSLLIAAAALTKYFGASLIPLLAIYTLMRKRGATWQLSLLLVPVALLGAYEAFTSQLYDRELFSEAASYALRISRSGADTEAQLPTSWSVWPPKLLIALSFLGGTSFPIACLAPWLFSKRVLAAAAGVALAIALGAKALVAPDRLMALHMHAPFTWVAALQLGVFATSGMLVLWLAASNLVRRRSAEAVLLLLWVAGTFAFAGFLNWTCNVRSMLPIVPALGILIVMRIDDVALQLGRRSNAWRFAAIPAVAVAVAVAWADFRFANSARTAATRISATLDPQNQPVWFQGHWGFQVYMEGAGARAIDMSQLSYAPGDALVLPLNSPINQPLPYQDMDRIQTVAVDVVPWLATTHSSVGAGFYAAVNGPLPFAFGAVPGEEYLVFRARTGASR